MGNESQEDGTDERGDEERRKGVKNIEPCS